LQDFEMQRLNAASCLLFALITGPAILHAAERVRVEVVQTHTGMKMKDAAAAMAATHCSGTSGVYSKEPGYSCADANAGSDREGTRPNSEDDFFYDIDVILPGETRLILHCSSILGKNCSGLPYYPEATLVSCSNFEMAGAYYKDCTASAPAPTGIGVYEAALHGNKVTIFGTNWKRDYLKYGTWQMRTPTPKDSDTAVQEPKDATSPPAAAQNEPTIDPQELAEAKAGVAVAEYKLGYDYYLGRGIAQDYAQAAIWWRKAAEQGYASAQNNLGVMYNRGQGVPQSYADAYFWENLAAARANGSLQAMFAKNRDDSASRLGFFERLRAQKKATEWFAKHPPAADQVSR
jgi:Sel1 repeat